MPDTKLWVNSSFHSALKKYFDISFFMISHEKSIHVVFPYRDVIVFLWLLSIFFVFSFKKFNYDVYWHGFLGFILFRVSWISMLMFFIKFGKFSVIISSNVHSFFPLFPLLSWTPVIWMLAILLWAQRSLRLWSLFLNLFSIIHIGWILLFCPHAQIHHLHSTVSPSSKSLISIFQFYNFFCITSISFLWFFYTCTLVNLQLIIVAFL